MARRGTAGSPAKSKARLTFGSPHSQEAGGQQHGIPEFLRAFAVAKPAWPHANMLNRPSLDIDDFARFVTGSSVFLASSRPLLFDISGVFHIDGAHNQIVRVALVTADADAAPGAASVQNQACVRLALQMNATARKTQAYVFTPI